MKKIYKANKPKKRLKFVPACLQRTGGKKWHWDSKKHVYTEYYNDKRWKILRGYVKRIDPICRFCNKPVETVHHIVPVDANIELFYELSNLAALCENCHKKIHASYSRGLDTDILFPEDEKLKYK